MKKPSCGSGRNGRFSRSWDSRHVLPTSRSPGPPLPAPPGLRLDRKRRSCHIHLRFMKLSKKNRPTFLSFLGLGFLIGTLAWEVLERILLQVGIELALGIGPVGFDLSVLSFFVKINPGTFIGILGGIFLFRLM